MKLKYIDIAKKKKKNTEIYNVLKFSSMCFHILKSLYDSFIINTISYIIFVNVHNQAIIKLLISHSITNTLPKKVKIKQNALSFFKICSN